MVISHRFSKAHILWNLLLYFLPTCQVNNPKSRINLLCAQGARIRNMINVATVKKKFDFSSPYQTALLTGEKIYPQEQEKKELYFIESGDLKGEDKIKL